MPPILAIGPVWVAVATSPPALNGHAARMLLGAVGVRAPGAKRGRS